MRGSSLLPVAFTLILVGCGPSNYDDCIIEAMQQVSNDKAVLEAKLACARKFKSPATRLEPVQSEERLLTKSEVDLIVVSGRFIKSADFFFVSVYNGNSEVVITNFDLVVPFRFPNGNEKEIVLSKPASGGIVIDPQSASDLVYALPEGKHISERGVGVRNVLGRKN